MRCHGHDGLLVHADKLPWRVWGVCHPQAHRAVFKPRHTLQLRVGRILEQLHAHGHATRSHTVGAPKLQVQRARLHVPHVDQAPVRACYCTQPAAHDVLHADHAHIHVQVLSVHHRLCLNLGGCVHRGCTQRCSQPTYHVLLAPCCAVLHDGTRCRCKALHCRV